MSETEKAKNWWEEKWASNPAHSLIPKKTDWQKQVIAKAAVKPKAQNPRFNREHWLAYIRGEVKARGKAP